MRNHRDREGTEKSMALENIEFRENEDIPAEVLHSLFRKEQWNDFFDLDDMELHLQTALHVVSAWHRNELVGYGRLEGDGRIWVEISDVLVKSECRGRGIGTEIIRRLVEHIKTLDPYYIQVTPISDREVHLYSKFGFTEIPDYRRMELTTEKLARFSGRSRR